MHLIRQILKIKQGSSTGVRYKSFSDKENAIPENNRFWESEKFYLLIKSGVKQTSSGSINLIPIFFKKEVP